MSKNDKIKVRCGNLYKDKVAPSKSNHRGIVGINLPYEHGPRRNSKQRDQEFKDHQIAYRAVKKSIACYQFTPIFFSSEEQEIVWKFKYPMYDNFNPDLNSYDQNEIYNSEYFISKELYANVLFEMGENRNIDYFNAFTTLIRIIQNLIKEKINNLTQKEKKNFENIKKVIKIIKYLIIQKIYKKYLNLNILKNMLNRGQRLHMHQKVIRGIMYLWDFKIYQLNVVKIL